MVGEAKTPIRAAYSWIDGAAQIHDDYEQSVPQFFVPNVFSFATEGKDLRYGTVGMPVELWGPWREAETDPYALAKVGLEALKDAVNGVLKPTSILDFLRFFTVYATDAKHRKIKIIARFQQFQATNLIVERVLHGQIKQGLIWHFQGSGKSLLMVFTALKLRAMAELTNPTILIVVDRIDLDTQITGTFNASDVPALVSAGSRQELQTLLGHGRGGSSSRRSTSSARRPGCSTTGGTSSRWSTKRTVPKRGITGSGCVRRCPTHSCSD